VNSTAEHLAGAPLSAVTHELLVLALMGAILLPLGPAGLRSYRSLGQENREVETNRMS
jgi:hypothetical protein